MDMNNFNIGIGARKAKKLGSLPTATETPVAETAQSIEARKMIELRNDLTETIEAPQVSALASTPSSDKIATQALSKDEIIKLAQKHGLKFEGMKKEFVKHTYSVTLDSKTLFKKYCDILGLNMQDAMEESLQDFFKKHALEYNRVKEAKRS